MPAPAHDNVGSHLEGTLHVGIILILDSGMRDETTTRGTGNTGIG
jgi:hypothetical protein